MSLVLEALRKQQADSDPSAAVALSLVTEQRRRQRTWIALLAVALLLNAAVFAWLFRDRLFEEAATAAPAPAQVAAPVAAESDPPAAAAVEAQTPAGVPAGSPAAMATPATAPIQPFAAAAANQPGVPAAGAVPDAAGAPEPGAATPPVRIIERILLEDLPVGPRSRFPGIAFSTHIYAEDRSLRAIVANGDRLQEGDQVAGLLIREITEQGVVLEFESYLVEVPVFTEW